jgi:hypothetical protein
MLSKPGPLPRLLGLKRTRAHSQIQASLTECDGWLDRLAVRHGLPRAALVRLLDRPGALERAIADWIVERAWDRARQLLAEGAPAPGGDDLYSRAIAGCYAQLRAARDAARRAEERTVALHTDEVLRRIKAGEDVDA